MKIAIACDHGALALKEAVKAHLTARGMECVDFGTFTKDSCDYPDFARPAAEAVASGACERGIVMCTTGIGVSITANKVHGIRCALLSDPVSARLTREHNDANMMALGAGFVGELLALEIVDTFLDTPFSNGERHKRRIEKLLTIVCAYRQHCAGRGMPRPSAKRQSDGQFGAMHRSRRHAPLICHCEEAAGRRGNLGKTVTILPGLSCDPAGYCEIATAPSGPRNDTSGGCGSAPAPLRG